MNREALEQWLAVAVLAGPDSYAAASIYNSDVYHTIVELAKAQTDFIHGFINIKPLRGTLVWQQLRSLSSYEEYITVDALTMSYKYQYKLHQRDSLRPSPLIPISTLLSDEPNRTLYSFFQGIIYTKESLIRYGVDCDQLEDPHND